MPSKPTKQITATQFIKGSTRKILIDLLKKNFWQLRHILFPITGKQLLKIGFIDKASLARHAVIELQKNNFTNQIGRVRPFEIKYLNIYSGSQTVFGKQLP